VREQLTEISKMVYGRGALPSYSVAEVQEGFKAHPDQLERNYNC
jgi:hypothetical protein